MYKLKRVNSGSRSVLPWDALPVRGTLFSPARWRPFSLVPTTSSAAPPSQTAASSCVAPTAACPRVSPLQPVKRSQSSAALCRPLSPSLTPTSLADPPFVPLTPDFPSTPQEPMILWFPLISGSLFPSLSLVFSLSSVPPLLPFLVSLEAVGRAPVQVEHACARRSACVRAPVFHRLMLL